MGIPRNSSISEMRLGAGGVLAAGPDSNRVGAASQFIEVPDLKKRQLALSGIVVADLDPAATSSASGLSISTFQPHHWRQSRSLEVRACGAGEPGCATNAPRHDAQLRLLHLQRGA